MMLWLACREDPLLFVLPRGGVLWLGEIALLPLPVDAHRYVRQRACRQQLWLAVYFSRHQVNLWRSAGGTALSAHSRLACGLSCAIGLDFVTAALALWGAKPWRARFIRQHS